MKSVTHCYVGRKPCGCIVGIFTDNGDVKNTLRWFKEFLTEGLTIDRLTVEEGNKQFQQKCTHEPQQLDMFKGI